MSVSFVALGATFRHSVLLSVLLNFFGISGDPLCQSAALCAPGGDVMAFHVAGCLRG